jgi:hypothetical protein
MPEFISINGNWIEKATLEFRNIASIPEDVVIDVIPVTEVIETPAEVPVVKEEDVYITKTNILDVE